MTRNDALVASIVPVDVTEPCPESESTEGDVQVDEQTRLEPMLGQVLAYGGEHSDEFGSYGFMWHSGDDASVFIAFTSSLDVHRQALEAAVALPDELIVCQVALPEDAARALFAKLIAELAPAQVASVGLGARGVEVTLLPGNETTEDQLKERYGDAVAVTVCPDETSCTAQPL